MAGTHDAFGHHHAAASMIGGDGLPNMLSMPGFPAHHGFFGRLGGVSQGVHRALNCSLARGDNPTHVRQNRALVARRMGVLPSALRFCAQVHGADVFLCDAATPLNPTDAGPAADGLVSATAGLCLGVVTADCVPVVLSNADASVVGVVHAGWRGMVSGICRAGVEAMAALGVDPKDLQGVIGPSIAMESYQVGNDVRQAFLEVNRGLGRFFQPWTESRKQDQASSRYALDLKGACVRLLEDAGVGAVALCSPDTYTDARRFFSARRAFHAGEGYGCQATVVRCGNTV